MTFLGAFRSTNRPVSMIIYACAVVSSSSNNKYATLIGPLSGDATSRGCVYDACSQETGPARAEARRVADRHCDDDRRRAGSGARGCSGSREKDTTWQHKQHNCSSSAALTPCRRVCSDQIVQLGQKQLC